MALLDIGLPVMDGYELAERLREGGGPVPRMIAITGHGQDIDRARSTAAGFESHLIKPVDLSRLIDIIGRRTPPPRKRQLRPSSFTS